MDRDLLINNFKEHKIFTYFWDDSILDYFAPNMELDLKPDYPMSYYQKKFEMTLQNLAQSDELTGMSAKTQLILTSMESKVFDVEKAITDIDVSGANHAIMVMIDVRDESGRLVFTTQFNLGSKDAEKINTNSENLKRFSFLY